MTTKEEVALLRSEVERLSRLVEALVARPQTIYTQAPNPLMPRLYNPLTGDPPGYHYSTSLRGAAYQ